MDASVKKYLAKIGQKGGLKMTPAKLAALKLNAKRPRPNARGKRKPKK